MRKIVYVALLLVALAVPVYASSFGDVITGSGTFGLKVENQLIDGRALWGLASEAQTGKGVWGSASKTTGVNYGVYGKTNSPDGWGLYTPNNVYVGGQFIQVPTASDFPNFAPENLGECSDPMHYGRMVVGVVGPDYTGPMNCLFICSGNGTTANWAYNCNFIPFGEVPK
jgi:hypothetical protein